jgi:hypothetical protein
VEWDGNKEANGDGNKGGRQATAMATNGAMVTAMRVAGDKKAMVTAANGSKDGRQAKATRATAMAMGTVMAMATATTMATATATGMATAMTLATVKATAKATATATAMAVVMAMRVAMAMVTATAMATTWAMMMVTRLAGDEEGKGKGGEGNDDGNEGGG